MTEPTTCPCPFPNCNQTMRMRYPGNNPENGPAEMHCPTHGAHSTFDSAGYLPVPEQNDEPHPSERLPQIGDRVDNLKNHYGTVIDIEPPHPHAQGAGTDVHVKWDDGSQSWIDAGDAEFFDPTDPNAPINFNDIEDRDPLEWDS